MATPAQIEANRQNARHRVPPGCGPGSVNGKARSCTSCLSHGFTSSVLFIAGEEREEFNSSLAGLHNEFQPATASEQILPDKILPDKIAQNQCLSPRAYRLQSVALNAPAALDYMPPGVGLLIRYHQSSGRGLYKTRNELLTARKERQKRDLQNSARAGETARATVASPLFALVGQAVSPASAARGRISQVPQNWQIGFESQDAAQPAAQPRDTPVRYRQSSDRGFYKARNELLSARKERQKSQIGFESQDASQPAAQTRDTPVRYHQSSDRGFYNARNELLSARKE